MAPDGRILVTGAGGFIGGRVVEVLHHLGRGPVRAGIRRWSSAARIGRFPVEIAQCDLTEPAQIGRALDGVDAVVHCAKGSPEVNVEGTRKLLEAAHKAGVRRMVHLSTIDVYGPVTGEVDESSPLRPTGSPYGDGKIAAERACREAGERGLEVAILRPTLVYGPFSESWTIEWAERLQSPPWMFAADDCGGTCNLVYVDDLVGAVLHALERPGAAGEAFNVNGPERPSWQAYFEALNAALGLPPLRSQSATTSHASAQVMRPVRATAKFLLARFDEPIMALYRRSDLAKRLMKGAEGVIRKAPTPAELGMLRREVSFATRKAQERLGWRPAFPMTDGIAQSAAWLRHHGYVPEGVVSRDTT